MKPYFCVTSVNQDISSIQNQPVRGFLGEGFLKICSKLTGEHPRQSLISIKMLCNFIGITLSHGCSPVSLLHIFRTPFPKKTCGRLLLSLVFQESKI